MLLPIQCFNLVSLQATKLPFVSVYATKISIINQAQLELLGNKKLQRPTKYSLFIMSKEIMQSPKSNTCLFILILLYVIMNLLIVDIKLQSATVCLPMKIMIHVMLYFYVKQADVKSFIQITHYVGSCSCKVRCSYHRTERNFTNCTYKYT